jgi:hypothetical protein
MNRMILLNSQMGTVLCSLRGVRSFLFCSVQKRATSVASSEWRLNGSLVSVPLEGLGDFGVVDDIRRFRAGHENVVEGFDVNVFEDETDGHLLANRGDFFAD